MWASSAELRSSATRPTWPTRPPCKRSSPVPCPSSLTALLSVAVELDLAPEFALALLELARRIVAVWLCGLCPFEPTNELWY